MTNRIQAYAAHKQGGKLEPFAYDPGPLGATEVEIAVEYCGVCHSDLSMLDNEWGLTKYPLVPGHEVVGRVAATGDHVTAVTVGQRVGLGWIAGSCLHCRPCLSGDQNLCSTQEATIVGRHGGFADRVRCQELWALPLPDSLDPALVGPLFCGGLTVFSPLIECGIKPTDTVGVIGIGGLGHLALKFLAAWGCEVVAFTSTGAKADEARGFGAHRIINSRSDQELEAAAGTFDFILNTTNVNLNWPAYLNCLRPKGRLHTVGVVPDPIPVPAFPLLGMQRSVSGSPVGSPSTALKMLDFCARHQIAPQVESFAMSDVNAAVEHVKQGQARYRVVLKA